MSVTQVEFTDLEKQTKKKGQSVLRLLASDMGKAYVIAICRDNCPACKRQAPRLNELADDLTEKHGKKLVFIRVHVKQPSGDNTESLRAKDLFGHYFYPTSLILFRTKDRGAIEYYRVSSPKMTELKRNIEVALETAVMLAKEKS
jgi:thiol-disulfide isomerase/thioredoxin